MTEHILSSEERAEYDVLLYEAGFDEAGKPRPSHEIGQRVLEMLRSAAYQAQRAWAGYVLEDIAEAGALARWRNWSKRREMVIVAGQSYVTTKASAMGVRKQDEDGRTFYQATFWQDMTREELHQIMDRSTKQAESEKQTIALARKLLALLDRAPEAQTVADASKALGVDLAAYLAEAA
jgi:hypothetical protein